MKKQPQHDRYTADMIRLMKDLPGQTVFIRADASIVRTIETCNEAIAALKDIRARSTNALKAFK